MQASGQLELQDWMTAAPTVAVMAALSADGGSPRFVGGCVRDALLSRAVKDIDIATPDAPEAVMERLAAAGLKSVPTGLKHGTITAVADGQPFEVTTLRRDVETDGRHAKVAFTDDWIEDAARRDLTINAIYCDIDGTLYDPFGGLTDIRDGHIRFVGDAAARIQEDVLRILRFYRFVAHYGQGRPDAEGLTACRELAHLLPGLSAERISAEVLHLLTATDPLPVICLMQAAGIWSYLLPCDVHINLLEALVRIETTLDTVDALRRLFALFQPDAAAAAALAKNFRLSKAQKERLVALASLTENLAPDIAEKALRRLLHEKSPQTVRDRIFLNQAHADGHGDWSGLMSRVADWKPLILPVQGRDAVALGVEPGPAVGELITGLERWWIDEDFRPGRAACLDQLKVLISRI